MNNYDRDSSVMINGRSYYLSGWSSPEKDGSRKVFMRLNHNTLCQMMQQDGDDETCTCLDELDFETCPNGHRATATNERGGAMSKTVETYEFVIDSHDNLTLKYPVHKSVDEAIKTTAHTIRRYMASGKGSPAFLEGDVKGDYIILERTDVKSHKNRRLQVKCRLCGDTMFRYTNKLKTPHRFCPAYTTPSNKKEDL